MEFRILPADISGSRPRLVDMVRERLTSDRPSITSGSRIWPTGVHQVRKAAFPRARWLWTRDDEGAPRRRPAWFRRTAICRHGVCACLRHAAVGCPAYSARVNDVTEAPVSPSSGSLRRAVALTGVSSLLVTVAGVVTQPVLARALGAVGRGEMVAAIVPAVLAGSVATLGLPDALTFHTARRPGITRRALAWSALLLALLGGVCLLVTWAALPFLSDGDAPLGRLMMLAMALTIPVLMVNAFRGAAAGLQMWGTIAVESLLTAVLRVGGFVTLWLTGVLTPLIAVIVALTAPALAGLIYLPLLRRRRRAEQEPSEGPVLGPLVSYGSRTWFGSVASMLVAKTDQILMTPLAGVRDLGLYSVATAVTDVPIIFALTASGALNGVNSRSADPERVTKATRVTLLIGLVGCTVLGASAPLWIVPLFGAEFADAVVPTLMLFVAAVLYIPGPMAGAGLASSGRPGLRSIGFLFTFVANVIVFIVLVPPFGLIGACWASIAIALVQSSFMVLAAARVFGVRAREFVVPSASDAKLVWREGVHLTSRVFNGVWHRLRRQ